MTHPANSSAEPISHWLKRRLWVFVVGGLLLGFIGYRGYHNNPHNFPGVVSIEETPNGSWDIGFLAGIGRYFVVNSGGANADISRLCIDGWPSFDIGENRSEFNCHCKVLADGQNRVVTLFGNTVTACDKSGSMSVWQLKRPDECPNADVTVFGPRLDGNLLTLTFYEGEFLTARSVTAGYVIPDLAESLQTTPSPNKLVADTVRVNDPGLVQISPYGSGWAHIATRVNQATYKSDRYLVLSDGRELFLPWLSVWVQYIDDETLLLTGGEGVESIVVEVDLTKRELSFVAIHKTLPVPVSNYGARPVPDTDWLLIHEEDYRTKAVWKWQYASDTLNFFLYDRKRQQVLATHSITSTDWRGRYACPCDGLAFDDSGRLMFLTTSTDNKVLKVDLHKWIEHCGGDL